MWRDAYLLDIFSLTKFEVFKQCEGMPIMVDVFFPTDDPSAPLWGGWVEGATIEVGPFDATFIAMVADGETVTFGYDRSLEWYVPVESAASVKFASKLRSRDSAA